MNLRGTPENLRAIPGPGYFGTLFNLDDPDLVATSLPIAVGPRSTDTIPVIVPTLTLQELAHLVDGGRVTVAIFDKAVQHAEARMHTKQSPFAQPGEQHPLPAE